MRAVARTTLSRDGAIKLLGERQPGEREPHPFRFGERDPHIFEKMLDEKSGIEVPRDHPRAEIAQAPRPRGAAAHAFKHFIKIQTRLEAVKQRLANADHVRRDQDLIDHFRMLARSGRTLMDDRFAHFFEKRGQFPDGTGVAADHDREPSLACSDVSSGDGSVDRFDAFLLRGSMDFDRESGLARRHIDQNRPRLGARERSLGAKDDIADVGGISDDREDDVGPFAHLARRIDQNGAPIDEIFRLRRRSIGNRNRIARVEQVAAHRPPHHSRTDPADFRRFGIDLFNHGSTPPPSVVFFEPLRTKKLQRRGSTVNQPAPRDRAVRRNHAVFAVVELPIGAYVSPHAYTRIIAIFAGIASRRVCIGAAPRLVCLKRIISSTSTDTLVYGTIAKPIRRYPSRHGIKSMLKPTVQVHNVDGVLLAEFWDCLRLDPAPVQELRKQFEAHLRENGKPDLIVDLKGVGFAGSASLGGFLGLHRAASRVGGRLIFCEVDPTVHEVFRASKIAPLFVFVADRAAALARVGEGPISPAQSINSSASSSAIAPSPASASSSAIAPSPQASNPPRLDAPIRSSGPLGNRGSRRKTE